MKGLLFYCQPLDPATGLRVDVRLSSVPTALQAGLGGLTWEGAVSRRPRFMQDLMAPRLDGKVITARGDFMVNLNHVKGVAEPKSLNWSGAPITVWDASAMVYATMPVEFSGIVSNASLDIWTGQIILNLEVDVGRIDRPLLTGEFTGGGGLNGDADKRGTFWPAGFGFVENCEPVWFDAVNNVGMLDGFNNLTTVHGLYEGGDDRGASFGDYASYALLVAAVIPEGRWATCLSAGLVRLGAPPLGRISCDCTFRGAAGTGANRPGALIRRILETHAGIPTGQLDTVSMAALDTAVPRNVHYWTAAQRGVKDLCEAIAASCNASMLVLLNGVISVTRAFGGANVGSVNRTGTSNPAVTDWQLAQQEEPVWRMRARTGRPGTVFQFNEILYEDDLIDMGAYVGATVYRQGNLVWMPDGSQWLYINATPSSGHSPPAYPATSDAWWQRTKARTTAADTVYADGTSIESLKPAAPGATRNIIYRQAADPAGAFTIYDGDIWVDQSGDIEVTKVRTAGAWRISATPNFITYSSVAPSSPVNGAIWVDTSVTPNVVRVRVAAGWQIASNLVTQGTDIGVSNGATASLTIIPVSSNIEVIGNSVRRQTGTGDWTAGWNSADAILAGCFAQWNNAVSSTYMVGLTDVLITNAANNFNQMDYAVYVNGTALTSYVNGVDRVLGASVAVGDVLSIAYDNISIRLYRTTLATGVTTLLDTFATTAGRRFNLCGTVYAGTGAGSHPVKAARFETFTNQNWGDMAGVGIPASNATADLTLTSIGATTVNITGNSIRRASGGSDFTACVIGAPLTGQLWAEVTIPAGAYAIVALDDDATSVLGQSLANIYIQGAPGGQALVYCNGSGVGTSPGNCVAGDKLAVSYDGVRYRAYLNGVQVGTDNPAAANLKLWPKWWDYSGAQITGLRQMNNNSNLWADMGGTGVPASGATADLTLVGIGTATNVLVGNSYKKTNSGGAHTGGAVVSSPMIGPQFVEADIIAGNVNNQISLDDAATDYTSGTNLLVYANYNPSTGGYSWGSNASITTAGTTASLTGKIRIEYDGTFYRLYIGGNLVGIPFAATAPDLKLWAKWPVFDANVQFTGAAAGPLASNAGAGITFGLVGSAGEINVVGSRLTKVAPAGWACRAYALEAMPNTGVWQFKLPPSSMNVLCMVGITETPSTFTTSSYETLLGVYGNGNLCYGWDNTNYLTGFTVGVTNNANDVWTIQYDGNTVSIWQATTLRGSKVVGAGKKYSLIFCPYSQTSYTCDIIQSTGPERFLDSIVDGATYGRTQLTELTGGLLRLTQAGGGRRLADARNMPNIAAMHLGFTFSGTISYTSTTTTATISVTAGTVTAGAVSISYGALSKGITGTASTTVRWYLYVDDPTNAGGSPTLQATTAFATWLGGNGYVCIGYVDVTFPASGTGGGGGSGGTGCVWEEAWITTRDRGRVQAKDIRPLEDWIKVENAARDGFEWEQVESIGFSYEECIRFRAANGYTLTLSAFSPMHVRSDELRAAYTCAGQELPVDGNGHGWSAVEVELVGERRVANIRVRQKVYFAGDVAGQEIGSHNPKP